MLPCPIRAPVSMTTLPPLPPPAAVLRAPGDPLADIRPSQVNVYKSKQICSEIQEIETHNCFALILGLHDQRSSKSINL